MTTSQQTKAPIAVGGSQAAVVGPVIIRLAHTRTGIYTLTVEYASTGAQIDSLRRTGGEDDMRGAARNAYRYFSTGGRVVEIDGDARLIPSMGAPARDTNQTRLTPAAKGTQTKISDPQIALVGWALAYTSGHIGRGSGDGKATVRQLFALARRGFLALEGPTNRPTGGTVTPAGHLAWLRAAGLHHTPLTLAA